MSFRDMDRSETKAEWSVRILLIGGLVAVSSIPVGIWKLSLLVAIIVAVVGVFLASIGLLLARKNI